MSKKLIIPKESLPDINVFTENYEVRFRITTEDRNRFSYWSPIFSINPGFVYIQGDFDDPGTLVMQKHTGYVASTWDSVSIYKDNNFVGKITSYDFWVQYAENSGANPSDWIYRERVATTSMNENIPATYVDANGVSRTPRWLRVEIYAPGRPTNRYTDLEISITQNGTSVDTTNDTVTASAHGFSTGDIVVYNASSVIGNLSTDTAYFIRVVNANTFSLYSHRSEAIDNVNKINLSSTGSGTGTFARYPFLLYKNKVTTL